MGHNQKGPTPRRRSERHPNLVRLKISSFEGSPDVRRCADPWRDLLRYYREEVIQQKEGGTGDQSATRGARSATALKTVA
jgi:hypothetical protein